MGSILKPVFGSLPQRGHRLSIGLVGFWLFNEGAGNMVRDLSGNGHHGIITGATWSAGPDGTCLYFNGNMNYITISPLLSFLEGSPYTIIAYAKRTSTGTSLESLCGQRNTDTYPVLFERQGSYIIYYSNSGGYEYTPNITDFTDWHQIAITTDNIGAGSTLTYYFNGLYVDVDSLNNAEFNLEHIGSTYNINNNYDYEGYIDHLLVYNRVLSASEIALLYREPFCMFGKIPVELWAAAAQGSAGAVKLGKVAKPEI